MRNIWPDIVLALFVLSGLLHFIFGVEFIVAAAPCLAVCFWRLAILMSEDED